MENLSNTVLEALEAAENTTVEYCGLLSVTFPCMHQYNYNSLGKTTFYSAQRAKCNFTDNLVGIWKPKNLLFNDKEPESLTIHNAFYMLLTVENRKYGTIQS